MITLAPPNTVETIKVFDVPRPSKDGTAIRRVRQLIWLYFWLLLFEGALRKWVVPSLAAPLLIIRDPILLMAYVFALRGGVFPKNSFVTFSFALAGISFFASLLATISTDYENVFVTLFGIRTDFFHLPLIFLMPAVLDISDVEKFGRWFLITSIPMALLMVLQFKSGPYSFVNATAGGEGRQLDSIMGKIRPPGTFSYVTGIVQYFGFVAAFLLHGNYQKRLYSIFLLCGAGFSLLIAMAVSGSRSAVFAVVQVGLALLVCLMLNRRLLTKSYRLMMVGGICLLAMSWTQIFSEGMAATQKRFELAGQHENTAERFLLEYLKPFAIISDVPVLGYGLGVGTNAGAAMLQKRGKFLLAEGEWARIMLEGGPFFGLAFILLRISITAAIGWRCLTKAAKGIYLPALIFGASALLVLSGQLGQPTTLGFSMFGGGLCLAACNARGTYLGRPSFLKAHSS